jgi:2-phosphoglycerate kinase
MLRKILNRHPRNVFRVVILVKVIKRSEEFSRAKLKASIVNAGAKEKHATQIADKIARKVKDGTTTVLIRRWVITELRRLDAKAAEAYTIYKKPRSLLEAYMG